eukprot:Seg1994.1 transcript_id=Seg1994.1/GoldUCD/mRNA.D3Y31 product="Protein fantom" protein_id=Seg1994.1/GoldUCD/D3Y31
MNQSDTTAGDLPVRDVSAARGVPRNISEAKERQLVAALSRQDLEDKYLRLREDHMELKKLSRSQEEKMKQMATKLLRLFKDKKKIDGQEGVARRDTETSEFIEDLQGQIRDLNKANEALKNKLTVTKQHLLTQGKKQTPYDNVKPRVETGISSGRQPNRQQRIKDQMRVQGQPDQRSSARSPQPLLPQPSEDLVASLQEQIRLLENEREVLKEQGRIKDLDREEDRARYETQIRDLKNSDIDIFTGRESVEKMFYENFSNDVWPREEWDFGSSRANMKENVELIRLEREIKEKSTKLEVMQGKFHNLEQMLEKVKLSNERALGEMESLTMKLKERERRFRLKEREYQVKISQLEAVTKADVLEKNELLDKLSTERGNYRHLPFRCDATAVIDDFVSCNRMR